MLSPIECLRLRLHRFGGTAGKFVVSMNELMNAKHAKMHRAQITPEQVQDVADALDRLESQMEMQRDVIGRLLEIQMDEFNTRMGK